MDRRTFTLLVLVASNLIESDGNKELRDIYILKIVTDNGIETVKFVKN